MHTIQTWLSGMPPGVVYLLIAVIVGLESMGVPLPGEIVLVSGALLASTGYGEIAWVAVAGSAGAIAGDSAGYLIGHRGGRGLLARLGRRFPRHFGPAQIAHGERIFARWGVAAVFFGRFIALLRILAGPLAGALRVPYPKFLAANASGGIIWAAGTALAVYYIGKAAEQWLSNFSWVALLAAVVAGVITTLVLRRRAQRAHPAEKTKASIDAR